MSSSQEDFSGKIFGIPPCSGFWGAVPFPHLPQLGIGNFLLFSALLEGSGLSCWVVCGWAHGIGLSASLSHPAAPRYPNMTLAGAAEQRRGSCVTVVFYDHYLDKSQFHCGVMLIIVSAKLDLLSLPPAPPFPIDLKLSLMIHCWVTFPCFLGRGRL